MFSPDADESPYHPSTMRQAVEVKGPAKSVKHSGTRLAEQDETPSGSMSAPSSPTRSRIDGTYRHALFHRSPWAMLEVIM